MASPPLLVHCTSLFRSVSRSRPRCFPRIPCGLASTGRSSTDTALSSDLIIDFGCFERRYRLLGDAITVGCQGGIDKVFQSLRENPNLGLYQNAIVAAGNFLDLYATLHQVEPCGIRIFADAWRLLLRPKQSCLARISLNLVSPKCPAIRLIDFPEGPRPGEEPPSQSEAAAYGSPDLPD